MQVRPDLDKKLETASTDKKPFLIDERRRQDLMEVLLKISDISIQAFDVMDNREMSPADVFLILQLPDWANKYSELMTRVMQDIKRNSSGPMTKEK